jgi:hypothetical protein
MDPGTTLEMIAEVRRLREVLDENMELAREIEALEEYILDIKDSIADMARSFPSCSEVRRLREEWCNEDRYNKGCE